MDRSLFLKLKAALSEVAEEEKKNVLKNEGTIFSKSGFKMNTKSGLSYLDNLYKLENIFKNNGNKEALQDVRNEIQSINVQLKNKKSPVEDQYVYFLDGTKVSYDPTLIQALEKGVRLATKEETKEEIRDEINYIKKQIRDKQFVDLGTTNKIALTDKHPNKNHLNSSTKLATKKSFALESFNDELEEDIEKHEELNPLLFEDDELKPEIKEAIEKIVNQFVEDLKTDGVKIEVKDIILVGSNVSYNYTKDSDLDIHIIVDKDTLDCDSEIYTLLYGAYRSLFNKNYDITIKGIPVEIYVELE